MDLLIFQRKRQLPACSSTENSCNLKDLVIFSEAHGKQLLFQPRVRLNTNDPFAGFLEGVCRTAQDTRCPQVLGGDLQTQPCRMTIWTHSLVPHYLSFKNRRVYLTLHRGIIPVVVGFFFFLMKAKNNHRSLKSLQPSLSPAHIFFFFFSPSRNF